MSCFRPDVLHIVSEFPTEGATRLYNNINTPFFPPYQSRKTFFVEYVGIFSTQVFMCITKLNIKRNEIYFLSFLSSSATASHHSFFIYMSLPFNFRSFFGMTKSFQSKCVVQMHRWKTSLRPKHASVKTQNNTVSLTLSQMAPTKCVQRLFIGRIQIKILNA